MSSLAHRIRRQQWRLRVPSRDEAFHWCEQFRDNWQDKLLPAFQDAFDRSFRDDRVIRIPKIELSLNRQLSAQARNACEKFVIQLVAHLVAP